MLRLPHHFYTDKIATGGNAQIAISSPLLDLQHGHTVVMLRLPNQLQNGHHTGGNAQVASPLLDLQNCHQWQCSDWNFLCFRPRRACTGELVNSWCKVRGKHHNTSNFIFFFFRKKPRQHNMYTVHCKYFCSIFIIKLFFCLGNVCSVHECST